MNFERSTKSLKAPVRKVANKKVAGMRNFRKILAKAQKKANTFQRNGTYTKRPLFKPLHSNEISVFYCITFHIVTKVSIKQNH